ncbi:MULTISPECIES: hypothetical protein [unclassified Sphingobium]|uniref:hypothetical protein n=1 Tax=unclassified Sphingobium TaxID=2611147 RepID=UPI0035A6317A
MVLVVIFTVLVVACSAFSALAAGPAGRWTAAAAIGTTLMGVAVSIFHPELTRIELLRLTVDVIFLVSLVALAVIYRRWWLIWMSAFQANGTLSHIVAMISPVYVKVVYYTLTTMWGIPILAIWVLGIFKDRGWRLSPLRHAAALARAIGRARARPTP